MMTPRDRVLTALDHRQPDRVPFSWGFGPTPEMARTLECALETEGISWPTLRVATEDILSLYPAYTGPALPTLTDIWGVGRRTVAYGRGTYEEVAECPLADATSSATLADYPWPDPAAYDDDGLPAAIARADPRGLLARRLPGGNPFEVYCAMTGLETAMMNLLAEPELVVAALERITGFFEARLRRMLSVAGKHVDVIFLADDLGSQNGLLFSRATYRAILQPFHRRLAETARTLAPRVRIMFHSDGAVFDIIPDLLDAGIEVLEAVQTDAAGMDPRALKTAFGARLSFHGAISVQRLLPNGTPAEVEDECRRLVEILGAAGGYIAAPAHAIQDGTPPENVLAMLRGVLGRLPFPGGAEV